MKVLAAKNLKSKHARLKQDFPEQLNTRIHRSLSWLQRAEKEGGDIDASFIFLWIAFNAIYGIKATINSDTTGRESLKDFFEKIISIDESEMIYEHIWNRYSSEIRVLLDNKYLFAPFWNNQLDENECQDWKQIMARQNKKISRALAKQDSTEVLSYVFDRLYVLRNQLLHGSSTWHGRLNRLQLKDGNKIMKDFVPIFITLMMDHKEVDWGELNYPVVSE